MGDSAGATEAAYAKLNTTSFEVDKTINELKIALIEIGNVLKSELAPVFEKVVKKIKELTSAFSNMSAAEKEQVVKIAGIVAAIGPLLAVGGRLITGIGTVMTMAPQIGTALSALTGPVGIVIAAVAALAAAFAALWTSDEGFRESVTGIFTDIQGAIQPLIDALGALWGAFQELLGSLWDIFGTEVMALFNLVFVETIFPIIQNLVEIFTGVVNLIVDIIHGDWSAAWEDLKSIVLNLLEILVDNVLGFFNKLLQTVGSITSKLVKGVIDLFMSLGHETATIINDLITDAINFWKDLFNKTIEIFGNIWDGIKEKVSGIKDAVVDGISGAVEFLSELPEKALTWGRDLIMSFINGIKEKVGQLTDEIEAVAEDIASFLGFSEPDKGPLSNFHTFAPDMMDLFTKGIRDNIPEVRKAAEDMAAAVAQPVNASTLTFNIANTINGAPGQNINDLAIAVDRRITTSVAQRRSAWA
jgi:phage-related protein